MNIERVVKDLETFVEVGRRSRAAMHRMVDGPCDALSSAGPHIVNITLADTAENILAYVDKPEEMRRYIEKLKERDTRILLRRTDVSNCTSLFVNGVNDCKLSAISELVSSYYPRWLYDLSNDA